jgi:uncharacterized protein
LLGIDRVKIRADIITTKPVEVRVDEPVESFPVLLQMQNDGECTFIGRVMGEITVEREFDHLKATGRVQVPVELACSRCLATYRAQIDSPFRIIFRKESTRQGEVGEETELSDEDLIAATYSGDEIDLTHEIEEQVAMGVPLKPLCHEECKGLCPTCGADLNLADCSCSKEPVNLKFGALKDFKVSR